MSSLLNFVAGNWVASRSENTRPVHNPASAEVLATVPLSSAAEVHTAVEAAHKAFAEWRRIPLSERVQFLFRLKVRMESDFEELSKTITLECGKTLAESRGEMRRAIENIEVACSASVLTQGLFSENVAPGIDEFTIRQPLGVCAIIAPFNFPGMIPFWFLPYSLVAGNTVVMKPSERVPLTMTHVFRILEELRLPAGVVNLVNGGPEAADALLDDERVQAVSFVGSSATARHVYARAAAAGKRVQCQGGAKNPIVIAADAHLDSTTQVVADSAFGCAGQRCLAASMAVLVGDARAPFRESLRHAAATRLTGFGMDAVQMGPVISAESRARIRGLIANAEEEGASVTVDGRHPHVSGFENGYFLKPTILEGLSLDSIVARTEIFGPVLTIHEADDLDQALAIINRGQYGNMACLFTSSGDLARRFRSEADAGNVGINVGVAAPMAMFPFSGARGSFFGDLHGQGRDAFHFFTKQKVVVERWPLAVAPLLNYRAASKLPSRDRQGALTRPPKHLTLRSPPRMSRRESAFEMAASAIRFGPGVTREIGMDLAELGVRHALVLTDPWMRNLLPVIAVEQSLSDNKVGYTIYDRVRIEPTDVSFREAIDFARGIDFDAIVAVGGGSTIDTAKAVNLYTCHPPEDFLDYVNPPIGKGKPVPGPLKPLFAVPTTAGTGSETTGVTIFDLAHLHAKTGIAHRRLKPTLGYLDPENTRTMPSQVAASTGLDVLSHAIESYTAVHYTERPAPDRPILRPAYQGNNPISDVWSLQALRMVGGFLTRAVEDTSDDEARSQMILASAYAGVGFGNAGVHLPHGMSYPVSGMVKGRGYRQAGYPHSPEMIPHGFSVILNAPAVFRFTAPACPQRHLEAAAALGVDTSDAKPADAGKILADRIIAIMERLKVPSGLKALGYSSADIPALVEGTLPQHRVTKLSPRPATDDDLARLFEETMQVY